MLKIDVALRKVLALPVKADGLGLMYSTGEEIVEDNALDVKIRELESELTIQKMMYEKAITRIAELQFAKDTRVVETPVTVVEKPVVVASKPVDTVSPEKVSELQEHFVCSKPRRGKAIAIDTGKKININTATIDDFMSIGMGEHTATHIERYRRKHGNFKCVDDLLNIPRFGTGCMAVYGKMLEV